MATNRFTLAEPITPVEAAPTASGRALEEFLILLEANLTKTPTLLKFVQEGRFIPSTVFTTSVISLCTDALDGSVDLTSDCLILSDLIRLYSFNFFGDTTKVYQIFKSILNANRTAGGNRQPLYKSAVDDFYFQDAEQLNTFLNDNELLLVIYIVSLVTLIVSED